jgi:hypothetical protein
MTQVTRPDSADELTGADRFADILGLIDAARRRAYEAVNVELVALYWRVGAYIDRKLVTAEWGDGVVDELAATIASRYPGSARLHAPQPLPHATVPRRLPGGHRRECATSGDTIAVDPSPRRPRSGPGRRRTRLLRAPGHQGALVQTRTRAPDRDGRLPAGGRTDETRLVGAGEGRTRRARRVEERVQPGVPRPPADPQRGGPAPGAARAARTLHHRAGAGLLLRRFRVPDSGGAPGLRGRPALLPPRPAVPRRVRTQGPEIRAGGPRQAELLPRGPRSKRTQGARAAVDRGPAVRHRRRRGRRVRARPDDVPDAGRGVPDGSPPPRQCSAPRLHEMYARLTLEVEE